jgi:metallo-beta-lactamase family protein
VNARIHSLGGLSAHAGRSELLEWLDPFARAGARIVLNHGEPGPRASLADALEERTGALALLPGPGDRLEL